MRFYYKCSFFALIVICFSFPAVQAQQTANQEKQEKSVSAQFGIVVDNSGSTRRFLETMIQSARKIAGLKQPDDEAFLVRFVGSDNIDLLVAATKDAEELANGADDMYPEGGLSAITDALFVSAKEFKEDCGATNCKRSLILISDGEERESKSKSNELFAVLKEKNVRVYAIRLIEGLGGNKEIKFLQSVTKQTGGKAYYPKTAEELNKNIEEIMQSLRQ